MFSGAGGTATWLASNYTQAYSTGGDFSYSGNLAVGVYQIALASFANMSYAENHGSGTLADGFVGLGEPDALHSGGYSLQVSTPVPELGTGPYLALGLALAALALRRQTPATTASAATTRRPSSAAAAPQGCAA